MNNSRTKNTIHGSDGISADRRLTKRTKLDETVEKNNRINALMKNIENGDEVMKYISSLKTAQETLTRLNLPISAEYWEINEKVTQEKLKGFLKLWFFPLGGGKLSKTKKEQLEALNNFNLTKDGIDAQIKKNTKTLHEWKRDLEELNPTIDENSDDENSIEIDNDKENNDLDM